MNIAVMGSGAVGGYFGGMLSLSGHNVTLIARAKRANTIKHRFTIKTDKSTQAIPINVVDSPNTLNNVDLVLIAVKLYANAEVAELIKPMIRQNTSILTLQNGLEPGHLFSKTYGAERVIESAVYIEAEKSPNGVVQSGNATPRLIVGCRSKNSKSQDLARKLATTLQTEGVNVVFSQDIASALWIKVISVGAFGSLMAASRSALSDLVRHTEGVDTLRTIMQEIALVATAIGVKLPATVVDDKLNEGLAEAKGYRSSMLQDLLMGKLLELEWLLGAVVRYARQYGIATPASNAVVSVLMPFAKGIE